MTRLAEWANLTAQDYMNTDYMKRAYAGQAILKDLMREVFDREIELTPIDDAENEYTIPYPEFINIIENNIAAITVNGYVPLSMQPVVKWQGEFNDLRPFMYSDVNRWFESLIKIEEMIYGSAKRMLITGMFQSGDSRTRQLLRTVN